MKSLMTSKVFRPIAKCSRKLIRFTTKNSNWILSILALLGVIGTAEEFTRATIKAVKLCEEKKPQGAKEIVKTVWKLYLPGVGIIFMTTMAVCGNAKINARRLATVTGLYAASQADIQAFKAKAKELLGPGKAKKIEDEVERDRVDRLPPPSEDQIIKTGHGNDLFQFGWTGVYFRANPDYIELKFRELNQEISATPDGVVYMHRLIEMLGMPQCDSGNAFWDMYDMLEHGYKKIEADITNCKWMDVNGKQEMVSTLRPIPEPNWL